ncbi:MAG: Bpu10I restriction endonuclease beta subunit [Bacilli bacterium]|nr:Bpu10I restriction endonuclease beta subunit [Bacilli bacterium]
MITFERTVHGKILNEKKNNSIELEIAFNHYCEFRRAIEGLNILSIENIRDLVNEVNDYRSKVINIFESRPNSGQEGFRSTILEEFFYHLFKDLVSRHIDITSPNMVIGKENSYVSLSFTPRSFSGLFIEPHPSIHTKDQDFVLGCSANLKITPFGSEEGTASTKIIIPVLAIECKTYIERNMLDSCAGTARRIKAAMPYCLYLVASEFLKMEDASPELTDIDEVYILCRAKNSERESNKRNGLPPHKLDPDLVVDLFYMVEKHLNRIWWDPENALQRGKIIGRP